MKKLLTAMFATLLMAGCGIEEGLHATYYENGQKESDATYKDGELLF